MVIRYARAAENSALDDFGICNRDACVVSFPRTDAPALHPGCRGLLVLRNPAFGIRFDDRRYVRHSQPRRELWLVVYGLGGCGPYLSHDWRTGLRCVWRIAVFVLCPAGVVS